MKEIFEETKVAQVLAPVVVKADISKTITLDGSFDALLLAVSVGASGDTLSASVKLDVKVEESFDDGATFAAVKPGNLLGATPDASGVVVTVDAADDASRVYKVAYTGGADKLKVTVDVTGTHTNGTPVSIDAIMGHKRFSGDTAAPTVA